MTVWAVALAIVASVALVVIPIWGWLEFNPNRARHVKYAEQDQVMVQSRIVELAVHHPEIVRVGRMDRHPWFLVPHVCVFGYTICVFMGAQLTSNVTALGASTRYTMAICFLVGAVLVLTGAAMGLRVGGRVLKRDVVDHLTAVVLGDDIVLPYRLSMAGMGAMIVSALIYSTTSFQSTSGSLGGWLTGGVVVACVWLIVVFYRAVRQFQKWDAILISEAKIRAGLGDGTC